MARLVAGQGFALDLDEARLANGFVADAFTTVPDASSIAAGAGSLTVARTVAGRTHATLLDYAAFGSGVTAAVRFTGLSDRDASGLLRYRIEGLDVALTGGTLDRLGARIFQQIDGFAGADGNDSVYLGVPGGRSFDGGGGTDRAIYTADPRRYALQDGSYRAEAPVVVALDGSGRRYAVVSSRSADTLTDVELVTIDGRTAAPAALAFDARNYLAANRDLAVAFGDNVVAAAAHYSWYGRNEGRSLGGFDALGYLGANPDVLRAVGVNAGAALQHYLSYGAREGRTAGFDPYGYLASNPDVLAAYGADPAGALTHYAQYGLREGRTASGFDGMRYLASYSDLIAAFGSDSRAATRHYLLHGRQEGRAVTFDAAAYLAANPDVAAATGGNASAAAAHYIAYGLREGRALRPAARTSALPAAAPLARQAALPAAALEAAAAAVVLTGTAGNDTMSGSAAFDALGNAISDAVDGLGGIDSFVLTGALASYSLAIDANGNLVVSGPDGTDTLTGIELLQATDGIHPVGALVGFSQPSLTGLTVSASASSGNDYLVGGVQGDAIGGGGGNDTIAGLLGNDTLFGNAGSDALLGGDGLDQLEGGAGGDLMFGGAGDDLLRGDVIDVAGNDTLLGEDGNDWLDAGAGNDWLDGGVGDDTVYGGLGGDVLRGGGGDDVLFGDVYSDRSHEISVNASDTTTVYEDVLLGGAGNDTLVGGYGADLMDGGAGADVFSIRNRNESTLAAPDVIITFNGAVVAQQALQGLASYATVGAEGDRIDVSEIDAITGTTANDAFSFVGTAGFTAAGQLRYQTSGAATLIEGDVNGDRTADFRIQVNIANYTFSAFDFVL